MQKFRIPALAASLMITLIVLPWKGFAEQPISYVQRAEAAKILLQYAGVTVAPEVRTYGAYPDILDGEWYVPYIVSAIAKDMLGVEKTTGLVYPHKSVTRAEFLKMMTKAFGLTSNIPYQFTDVRSDAWYAQYAGIAWRYTLFGTSDVLHLLQPERRVTHEEAIGVIYTLLAEVPSLQQKQRSLLPLNTAEKKVQPSATAASPQKLPSKERNDGAGISTTATSVKHIVLKLLLSRGSVADQTRNTLMETINNARATYNLAPLRYNYALELSAQKHAKDMYRRGYFSHYSPEGLSYVDRIKNAGYGTGIQGACTCTERFNLGETAIDRRPGFTMQGARTCSCQPKLALGENLAKGQLTVEQVLEDWMNSPRHRENILRKEFSEIGIGLFGNTWVQNFGDVKFE